jgi:hypothetical protein
MVSTTHMTEGLKPHSPPVTVSNEKALKRQLPTCRRMQETCPCRMSSRTAGSKARLRVCSFFLRRLCMVRKRPLQMWRFFGLSVFSSAIKASISGRSRSAIDMRLLTESSAARGEREDEKMRNEKNILIKLRLTWRFAGNDSSRKPSLSRLPCERATSSRK